MKQCLNPKCKKEFTPKRERGLFCSDLCRASYHQFKKGVNKQVDKIMGSLEEVRLIEKGEKAAKLFEDLIKELGNPKLSGRNNALENAARGRDENGVNKDEVHGNSFQRLVDKAKENEIPRLKGESSIDYQLRCIEINETKAIP